MDNQPSISDGCISASVGNQLAPVPHKGQSATASNSNQLLGNQQQQAIRTATRTASTYCSWAIISSEHVRLENKRERVHKRPQASMSTSKARPRAKRVHEHSASTSTARPRAQRVHVHSASTSTGQPTLEMRKMEPSGARSFASARFVPRGSCGAKPSCENLLSSSRFLGPSGPESTDLA